MLNKILAAAAFVAISGCSMTPYENFDPRSIEGTESLRVVSQVQQEELVKEFVPSNAGGSAGAQFGLVGALVGAAVDASVNNARAKDAEESVEPFRNATLDIDVRNLLERSLAENTSRIEWVSDKKLVSEQFPAGTSVRNYLKTVDEDLLLLINTSYSLKPNAEVLEFAAYYALYDRAAVAAGGKSKAKPVYANTATLQSYPHNGSIRRLSEEEKQEEIAKLKQKYAISDDMHKNEAARKQKRLAKELNKLEKKTLDIVGHNPNGSIWLANDAAILRKEMLAAPPLLAKMIVNDLTGEYPLPVLGEGEKRKTPKQPQLLEEFGNGMTITRQPNGVLLSKHRSAPKYTLYGNVF